MAAAPALSAELERQLAMHRENRGGGNSVSAGAAKSKQFTASIDEDAAHATMKGGA